MKRHILLVVLFAFVVSAAAAQNPFEVFVYVDRDTLTLHVPSSGVISLEGIGFQVQVNNAARTVDLADYPAFGLPFDQLPTPICFRLRSSGSRTPLPQACSSAITLTQDLAAADVFWYDAVAETSRVILVTQNGVPFTICPSGASECTGTLTPPEATSTPAPTETPELAFEPATFTAPDGLFMGEYPTGWITESLISAMGGTFVFYSSEETRAVFETQGYAPSLQSGQQAMVIRVQVGTYLPEMSPMSDLERHVAQAMDILRPIGLRFEELEYTEAERVVTAQVNTQSDGVDGVYLISIYPNEGYFLEVFAYTAIGERSHLLPVVNQLTASIQVNLPDATSESPVATVSLSSGTGLNMRESPSAQSRIQMIIQNGTSMPILAVSADGEWYRVSYEGFEGWIMAEFVSVTGDVSTLPRE